MVLGPFASAADTVDVSHGGERYVPLVDPYNAAMHLGHMASYKYALRYAHGRRVLDVGCGTGYGAHYLASYGARRVVAVDVDQVALDYARVAYSHPCVHYQCCDGQRLPFADASFDFVFSSQVIEHMPDTRAFLTEIKRVLEPQGACLIITPNKNLFSPDSGGEPNEFHINEMNLEEFEALGRDVFPDVRMLGIPQNCLQIGPDGVVRYKPSEELCLEDYQVQTENLALSENLLLWGYREAGLGLPTTLPDSLSGASTNPRPCFWDAAAKQWIELGLYPIWRPVDQRTTGVQPVVRHHLRPSSDNLFRIDIALGGASAAPVELTLRDGSRDDQVLVHKAVQPSGKRLQLVFEPIENSANRSFLLEIGRKRRVWDRLWHRKQKLPQFEYRGGQLAVSTFHLTLPPVQNC